MQTFTLKEWKFHYNDCPEAWFKGFEDETWEDITVPHDWSVHMPFSKEYSSGTGYLAGGIGWYRTNFKLPETLKGKKIFITFDGVYKNSQVWCNSYYLGKRPSGYTTFQYDITDQVSFGDTVNIIAVKVDHRDIADSRWFTGSGITRKVSICALEAVHTEFNGIFFTTPIVTDEKTDIEITNTIINDTTQDVILTVENTLFFKNKKVLSISASSLLPAGGKNPLKTNGTLLQPALWSTEAPNLYELTTRIHAKAVHESYSCTEEISQKVGIRKVLFDSDKGLFVNSKPIKLKGVCLHHDAGCLGAAVLPEVWYRRLLTLKEMGCNAIRMSHNPHTPELYDLCDALGFFCMDEAFDEWEGVKNKWSVGHNVYPPKHQGYFEDFPQWHEKDLSDLIKRDRNHPSIIAWSIGNEIDYPNDPYCHPLFQSMIGNNDKDKPASEWLYNGNRPNSERLSVIAKELTATVKQYDTTRPVLAAVAFPELSTRIGFTDSFDIVGYNYKEQFYEEDHRRFPDKPLLGSENSHSYEAWKAVRDNEYISGQFLWTGIDYLGEAKGWPYRASGSGSLTLAGFPKTTYYSRQSYWLESPVLYLTTAIADLNPDGSPQTETPYEWKPHHRSWNYMPGDMIEVRCFTNQPRAALYCNDKLIAEKSFDNAVGFISWFIPFVPGTLKVIGYNKADEEKEVIDTLEVIGTLESKDKLEVTDMLEVTDTLVTTGAACGIRLKKWTPQGGLNKCFANFDKNFIKSNLPDTFTLTQIEVTITDSYGNLVPNDSTKLQVTVSGSGKLIGIENGDITDLTEYTATYRRAYEGRMIIYVNKENDSETINITVSGSGLKKALMEI